MITEDKIIHKSYLWGCHFYTDGSLPGLPFSSGDSLDIYDLASLCPWEGHRAMTIGQELYSTINNQGVLPSIDNCPSPSPFIISGEDNHGVIEKMIQAYPNPVVNNLHIRCEETIDRVEIFSSEGKPIIKVEPNDNRIMIDMNDLAVGFYLVKVTIPSGQITKPIALIR